MMNNWKKETIQSLIDRALKASIADNTVVNVSGFQSGATRYANSEINQNVVRGDLTLSVEATFGASSGQSSTNVLKPDAIAACVKQAEDIARLTPPDPEYMPPVEPAEIEETDAWSEGTATATPTDRAAAIARAVTLADKKGLTGAGAFETGGWLRAMGNSAGHFVYGRNTSAELTFSATSDDSVGWAQGVSRDVSALDIESIAQRGVDKALNGRAPQDLEPGRYEVILEPSAVGSLISSFIWNQLDAKASDEGRTFMSGKNGAQIAAPLIHLYSDPHEAACPARPFNDEGMPLQRLDWIRDGVVKNLMYSRFWAKKQGRTFTGYPPNIIIAGGTTTTEEMIKSTKRGLLITRFWYIRSVDRMRDLYTGTTRDGTFLVEDGAIKGPVKNLRFNDSAVGLLSRVTAVGRPQLVSNWGMSYVPVIKASEFNFTSATKF